jgi:hypothetical protein
LPKYECKDDNDFLLGIAAVVKSINSGMENSSFSASLADTAAAAASVGGLMVAVEGHPQTSTASSCVTRAMPTSLSAHQPAG